MDYKQGYRAQNPQDFFLLGTHTNLGTNLSIILLPPEIGIVVPT